MQAERTRSARLGESFGICGPRLATLHSAFERTGWLTPVLLLVALAARLPFVVRTDVALNDGGLFVAMSQDLLANHFALPATTSYNADGIPFAYPPLAFYVDAVVHGISGADMLTLARWLPLVENLLTVVAVVGLARSVLGSSWAAALASSVFVLLPRSYEWMIMGGGLTRSLGYALAIACVLQAVYAARAPSAGRTAVCAVLAGLALAAHLEEGLFAVYSAVLALVCYGRSRRVVLACLGVCLGAVLVPSPWWVAVVAQHGPAPFLAASLTSGWSSPDSMVAAIGNFLAPASLPLSLVGGLAVAGAALLLLRGDLFAPAWLVAIFVLTPRSAPSEAVLPLALLASVGLSGLVLPSLVLASRDCRVLQRLRSVRWIHAAGPQARAAGLAVLLAAVYWLSPALPVDAHALEGLPPAERQAMAWIGQNTPPDERFLVLSSTTSWEEDLVGEWFPLLAGRQSVLTPQGAEWLPDRLHARKVCLFQDIRSVATWQNGIADLEAWASDRGVTYSDIYVSKAARGPVDWSAMLASAERSPNYSVLLETPAVAVLHRTTPLTARWNDSGQFVVANDCRSLADEGPQAMGVFESRFGGGAAAAWVAEHNQALPARASLTSIIARVAAPLVGYS